MQRRAEQVDETRQRITEAAVHLHTTVGPSQTSIAAVAEEAGVTRLTVYRHFADLDELFVACRAHWLAQQPPPDPNGWPAIADRDTRVRQALTELYGWYRARGDELYPIYRDNASMPSSDRRQGTENASSALPLSRASPRLAVVGHWRRSPVTYAISGRGGPSRSAAGSRGAQEARATENRQLGAALVAGFTEAGGGRSLAAVARHLCDFGTWRSFAVGGGLEDREIVEIGVRLIRVLVEPG